MSEPLLTLLHRWVLTPATKDHTLGLRGLSMGQFEYPCVGLNITRGSLYGVTAAFGTAGAVAGIHAFSAIDENLRKQ